jgi:hypothetical protein
MAKTGTEVKTVRLDPSNHWDKKKLGKLLDDGWQITSQSKAFLTTKLTYVMTRTRS